MTEYLHELPDWPNLRVDAARLAPLLARVHERRGALLERVRTLEEQAAATQAFGAAVWDGLASQRMEGDALSKVALGRAVGEMLSRASAPALPVPQLTGPLDIPALARWSAALMEAVERQSAVATLLLDAARLEARRVLWRVGRVNRPQEALEAFTQAQRPLSAGAVAVDALTNAGAPVTAQRLMDWQAALFPDGRSDGAPIVTGAWRTGPVRVMGPQQHGRVKVHFVGPDAARVPDEMAAFLAWLEAPPATDPLVHVALAHLRLLTVHPFEDGNGRVTRALTDLLLTRLDGVGVSGVPRRVYALSRVLALEKAGYEAALGYEQRGASVDVTAFVAWFLARVERAVLDAGVMLDLALARAQLRPVWPSGAAGVVLGRLLVDVDKQGRLGFQGTLTVRSYVRLTGVLAVDAAAELSALEGLGLVARVGDSWRVVVPDAAAGLVAWRPDLFVLRARGEGERVWLAVRQAPQD